MTGRASAPGTTLAAVALLSCAAPALAYRPFDGTDAAVADKDELEIEMQPAGAMWQEAQKTLIGPVAVLNYGFEERWEAVLEGQLETPFDPNGPSSFSAGGAFLKHVLRPGSLQDSTGPSIGTELGLLLPESIGDTGLGAGIAGIVSQRWGWGTVHFNAQTSLTRDHHADLFLSTILEGPSKWKVRPVAEFFYENEFGQAETVSALAGAIWQVDDNLAFDIGLRHALTNGRPVNEVRAGLTVGFPNAFGSPATRKIR